MIKTVRNICIISHVIIHNVDKKIKKYMYKVKAHK